jgi:uncharacterized protein (DUF433 family)
MAVDKETATPAQIDSRDAPRYLLGEAAHYLGVPRSTISVWSVGQEYPTRHEGRKFASPLIKISEREPPTLSFWNLVELYVLASIRRQYGIPLQRVRKAMDVIRKDLGGKRPLLEEAFSTDGVDLFVDRFKKLVNVTSEQLKMFLDQSVERIVPDSNQLAKKFYPWRRGPDEPKTVEIDPQRAFGRLVIAGTGIPTEIIAERFLAGDSIGHLAADYKLDAEKIQEAIRWETRAPAA